MRRPYKTWSSPGELWSLSKLDARLPALGTSPQSTRPAAIPDKRMESYSDFDIGTASHPARALRFRGQVQKQSSRCAASLPAAVAPEIGRASCRDIGDDQ